MAPPKQRHTKRRIFERLRDEYGYSGGHTAVKEVVRKWELRHREAFMPLSHPPGEAQVDFGRAQIILNGDKITIALFVMTLPYSDAIFVCIWRVSDYTLAIARQENEAAIRRLRRACEIHAFPTGYEELRLLNVT